MPLNKTHLINILFKQNIPLIEYLIKDIAENKRAGVVKVNSSIWQFLQNYRI